MSHRIAFIDHVAVTVSDIDRACRFILTRQLPDGGWNIFPSGPSEINATVRAYTSLKIAGHDIDSEPMSRARQRILALGGLQSCNSYTKINFSLFGLYPRKGTIAVGSDADLVIFDPNEENVISAKTHHMRVDYSMFEGIRTKGAPKTVFSRGRAVIENGKFVGRPGTGQFLRRQTHNSLQPGPSVA